MMKHVHVACLMMVVLLHAACGDDSPADDEPSDFVPERGACRLLTVRGSNLNPLYTYTYSADGLFLETYKVYDDLTGNVLDSYVLDTEYIEGGYPRLSKVTHYRGDFESGIDFSDVTIPVYGVEPDELLMLKAETYLRSDIEADGLIQDGTIEYVYRNEGDETVLEAEVFTPINETDFQREYTTEYAYDAGGYFNGFTTFNYNDVEISSEDHTLTTHYQPLIKHITNPELARDNRFAPASTTVYVAGFGQYTYQYAYQVNAFGYITQKDVALNNGGFAVLQLLEYACEE